LRKAGLGRCEKVIGFDHSFFLGLRVQTRYTYTHTHAYVSNRHQRDGKQNVDHLHFSVLTFLCYILEVCVNIRLAKAWLNIALALRSFLWSTNWFPVSFLCGQSGSIDFYNGCRGVTSVFLEISKEKLISTECISSNSRFIIYFSYAEPAAHIFVETI